MTGRAIAGCPLVIPGPVGESRGGMTEVAIQGCGDVTVMLADRGNAMAGIAIVDDPGMIVGRGDKPLGIVANPAILVGADMIGVFTDGESPIVAGIAVIDDAGVIEGRRHESRGYVAVAAIGVGRHVIVILADSGIAIVA